MLPMFSHCGVSVRGASHERKGQVNQDSFGVVSRDDIVIAAVSDGHGSRSAFRSQRGSQLATGPLLEQFLNAIADLRMNVKERRASLSTIRHALELSVPQLLTRTWGSLVHEDLQGDPLRDDELRALRESSGDAAAKAVQAHPRTAYGATLLVSVACDDFYAHLQLGDGDILEVTDHGEVHCPMPADVRLIANETTSLSLDKAWRDFRVVFQPLQGAPPAAILLGTDGLSNSFRAEADFHRAAGRFLDGLRTLGIKGFQPQLEENLRRVTQLGSGDDVTAVILVRADLLPNDPVTDEGSPPRAMIGPSVLVPGAASGPPPPLSSVSSSSPFASNEAARVPVLGRMRGPLSHRTLCAPLLSAGGQWGGAAALPHM
ncbi:MAG: PP2C family serine/threonine-protein phosphatase [Myxococcales bacterium]